MSACRKDAPNVNLNERIAFSKYPVTRLHSLDGNYGAHSHSFASVSMRARTPEILKVNSTGPEYVL